MLAKVKGGLLLSLLLVGCGSAQAGSGWPTPRPTDAQIPAPPLMLVAVGTLTITDGNVTGTLVLKNNAQVSDLYSQGALEFLSKDGKVLATLCTEQVFVRIQQVREVLISGRAPAKYDHTRSLVWPAGSYRPDFTCP